MKTSCFGKYRGSNGVSIARFPPKWWGGKSFPELAPPTKLLAWWKCSPKGPGEWERYSASYGEAVLSKHNPEGIVKELGQDAVMLCWCRGEPCHRRLVAEFLEYRLGIEVPEWTKHRTDQQNRSLHKYFADMANGLDEAGFTQRSLMEIIRGKLELPVTFEFCRKLFIQVAAAHGIEGDLRSIRGDKFLDVYQSFSPAIAKLTGVSVGLYRCKKSSPRVYLEELASELDSAGHSQNAMFDSFKAGFDIPVDSHFLKEVFREVMINMTGKKSTTKLNTIEVQSVFDAFDRAMSERTGVRLEWPCIDSIGVDYGW